MMKNVIAIVGMCGSGKSELTKLFTDFGYYCIYFGEITLNEIRQRSLSINEENEKTVREDLRKKFGYNAYAKIVFSQIEKTNDFQNVVLDGLYSWSEYKFLDEKLGNSLIVLAVVSNKTIRQDRLANRSFRPLSSEEVNARDAAEIENLEKGGPIACADYYIKNNSTYDSLYIEFQEFISWLNKRK